MTFVYFFGEDHSKQSNQFEKIKGRIKIKFFDFDNEFDNQQITEYVIGQLSAFGFSEYSNISYGLNIKYLKVNVNSYSDIVKLSSINGIKSIDLFQEYSFIDNGLKKTGSSYNQLQHYEKTDTQIGIIDTGISQSNQLLQNAIIAKESFVPTAYQNNTHATFIASTIQYGNELNGIKESNPKEFKLVDIAAIPNSDSSTGPTDTIGEDELMEIIETIVKKYSYKTKIWNLSIGIENQICDGNISDFGAFLDYIQAKYNVQFFIPSGNYSNYKSRTWPPSQNNEYDRIISPADSIIGLTVGSLALYDSKTSIVKKDQPSPFSRKGPGTGYTVKPELVDYGGNISHSDSISSLGMKGMDINGNITEGIGTSYSTPRVVRKFATIYDEMIEKDLLLSKAMWIGYTN
ncbi:S8 family peptidase [Orbus mooreae]|uniref:S8 family peptidase n=1 Tax=Orbus mooreae TaxID=3074107 RepID=UPI00370D63A2